MDWAEPDVDGPSTEYSSSFVKSKLRMTACSGGLSTATKFSNTWESKAVVGSFKVCD